MKLIFDHSRPGCQATAQSPGTINPAAIDDLPAELLRKKPAALPEVSELQAVRHYTQLSQLNFSIDTHFYPLGSCTMKYNPRGAHRAASLPGFLDRHPMAPESLSQGYLASVFELQELLQELTGMKGSSLTPMAGAQGEFAGVAMIRAYHESRNDDLRQEILIPETAHGTNPATATMCGYKVREVPVEANGDVCIEALKEAVGEHTAGLMMTNPSTGGVFERNIKQIAEIVHEAGGLLYYDGANLNAIMGKVRPGDMGFDVLHMNLHKTFATPHGGGGPGAGPVAVNERLLPFLPIPVVGFDQDDDGERNYRWLNEQDIPQTIGRLSAFMGNAGILLRALSFGLLLGRNGLTRASQFATLNANYMAKRLQNAGFELAYPDRRATHEFIITFKKEAKELHVSAMDIAKRLLDYGVHAPTTYFPLVIPECFLIEPTETESKEELDGFVDALISILEEARQTPELLTTAPHTMPVGRLDDVKAARELNLAWSGNRSD